MELHSYGKGILLRGNAVMMGAVIKSCDGKQLQCTILAYDMRSKKEERNRISCLNCTQKKKEKDFSSNFEKFKSKAK